MGFSGLKHPWSESQRGITLVELLVIVGIMTVLGALLLPALGRTMEARARAACVSNLKQVGNALKIYASESAQGHYPPMKKVRSSGEYPNVCDEQVLLSDLMFDGRTMVPEYLSDESVLICPSDHNGDLAEDRWYVGRDGNLDPCSISAISYAYVAWAINDDYLMIGDSDPNAIPPNLDGDFIEALGDLLADQEFLDGDFQVDSAADGQLTAYRLREGVSRFLITDTSNARAAAEADSTIAVFFDHISVFHSGFAPPSFNHAVGGGNVLYMDGHAEFVLYPSKYPVSVAWASTFAIFEDLTALEQ